MTRPPKAPLAFRVGVVGHRPDRLARADVTLLASVIREALATIRASVIEFQSTHGDLFDGGAPVLRAVSPLAEGSDRIFASEALALGYELCCPFPFPQAEFERDFDDRDGLEPNSLHTFLALLAKAQRSACLVRYQLDGTRGDDQAAYGAAGRVVVNQSDILLVVWDGERRGKIGGTETTFEEAQQRGVPVLLIDAFAPHTSRIIAGRRPASPEPTLSELVTDLLDLPGKSRGGHEALRQFYVESVPRLNPEAFWRVFRCVFGGARWRLPTLRVPGFEEAVLADWPSDKSSPATAFVNWLRPFYAWPDQLAVYYSNSYRGAFLLAYCLAALAVGFAVTPVAAGWLRATGPTPGTTVVLAEIAAITSVIVLIARGRRRRWHERWLDYRHAAELVRHLRLASLIGGERPFPQLAAHFAHYGQPGALWASWYVRAVERKCGLPDVTVDASYLSTSLDELQKLIEGQLRYHEGNRAQCHAVETRLHGLGLGLLAATLLAVVLHILPFIPHSPRTTGILIALAAFLPALGASLAGINNQGEFRRIARRSSAMADHLTTVLADIQRLIDCDPATVRSPQVAAVTARATQLMVNEVLDWRVVFLDRPLNPPS